MTRARADDAHYESLLKSNALSDDLAKQLEAYKHVASGKA
jgi:hypothetical protein